MPRRFRVQIVKYFSVWAGDRSVENLLDKIRMALVGLCDVGSAVCIALDKPFIPVLAAAGHKNDFLARWSLHVQAISVLILSQTAAPLEEVHHAVAVAVQDVQPGRGS